MTVLRLAICRPQQDRADGECPAGDKLTVFGKIRLNLTIGCLPSSGRTKSSVALIYRALLLSDGTKNVQITCKWAESHAKPANQKPDVLISARFEFALWVTSSEVSILLPLPAGRGARRGS